MRNISLITDHEAQARAAMTHTFRAKGNFIDFVGAIGARIQFYEDCAFSLIQGRYLSKATGVTLSYLGAGVGMPRPSYGAAATDDDLYRVLIYAKISANISQGTLPDLLNILGALGATNRKIFQIYPASITVNFAASQAVADCACVRDILTSAKQPVALDIAMHSGAGYFGFEGDLNASPLGVGVFARAG